MLVIDDDAALTRMVALTLRGCGFDVVTALHGAEALERIQEVRPDAIVLDLEMPVMDGRTFYRCLRQDGSDVPVMVMSANDARSARRELGAEEALEKPFDPDSLVRKVRELL